MLHHNEPTQVNERAEMARAGPWEGETVNVSGRGGENRRKGERAREREREREREGERGRERGRERERESERAAFHVFNHQRSCHGLSRINNLHFVKAITI